MKRAFFVLAAAMMGCFLPHLASAEVKADGGAYVRSVSIRVSPGDAERWEQAVRMIADAARKARSSDHDWLLYRAGPFRYWLILFSEGLSDIVTEESFSAAFAGTEGEALFARGVEQLLSTRFEVIRDVVTQQLYSWSTVRSMSTATHPLARVAEYWVRPDSVQQFDRAVQDYVAFLKKIRYPYPVEGFRLRLGAPGRYRLVTFPDDWSKFFGENRVEEIAAKHGATEELQSARKALAATLEKVEEHHLDFVSELSYSPD